MNHSPQREDAADRNETRLSASLRAFLREYGRTLLLTVVWTTVVLGILAFVITRWSGADGFAFEHALGQRLREDRSPARDALAVAFHVIGGVWGMTVLGLATATALYRSRPLLAWLVLSSMLGTALIGAVMRLAVDRERPAGDRLVSEPDGSFPSGHVMVMTVLMVMLSAVAWPTKARVPVVTVACIVVLVMMWARVYAGVHHLTDVVAGALAGLQWTLSMTRATRGSHLRP